MITLLSQCPVVTTGFTHEQDLWIQTLKSGLYLQTKHNLRDATGFCCLGVACEVLLRALNLKVSLNKGGTYAYEDESGDRSFSNLPRAVWETLKLTTANATLTAHHCDGVAHVTNLNDEKGWSFLDIANILERAPWLFFTNFERPDNVSEKLDIFN